MEWFTSDLHYGHRNIAGKEISSWKDGYRDFRHVCEMNMTIIRNINDNVAESDTLYIAGDLCFTSRSGIYGFLQSIICKNIHLILGNHDKELRKHPDRYLKDGLLSSISEYKEIYVSKQKICIFHYSPEVWNASRRGSWFLFGHSHDNLPESDIRKMDIGIDSAYRILGEYRPFSFDEIKSIMDKRI